MRLKKKRFKGRKTYVCSWFSPWVASSITFGPVESRCWGAASLTVAVREGGCWEALLLGGCSPSQPGSSLAALSKFSNRDDALPLEEGTLFSP